MIEYPWPTRGLSKKTRFRVVGPKDVNGMKVWTVHNIRTREQIGPYCFSLDEARKRIEDLVNDKKIFWFGNTPFVKKSVL